MALPALQPGTWQPPLRPDLMEIFWSLVDLGGLGNGHEGITSHGPIWAESYNPTFHGDAATFQDGTTVAGDLTFSGDLTFDGAGVPTLSDDDPEDIADTADSGNDTSASRDDHVHKLNLTLPLKFDTGSVVIDVNTLHISKANNVLNVLTGSAAGPALPGNADAGEQYLTIAQNGLNPIGGLCVNTNTATGFLSVNPLAVKTGDGLKNDGAGNLIANIDGITIIAAAGVLQVDPNALGNAATATSEGDPTGVVTAQYIGQVCIDTTTPHIYIATASGVSNAWLRVDN